VTIEISGRTAFEDYAPDPEWTALWKKIVDIFDTIDHLEELFTGLDVSYLRQVQQQQLILNLKRYAWSLQNLIIQRYGSDQQ
jgi:hypothetical protein